MTNAVQSLSYLAPSALRDGGLQLQTAGGVAQRAATANPRFFTGFLTTPAAASAGLLAVAEVARTRYFQPLSPASLDPVVTGSRDRLRFESFSGCCGVYARLDVLPAGLDGEIVDHGTTNVDVNTPLRQALQRVAGADPLHVSVGPDDLTVSTMDGAVVEKKVPLPTRWLRGFAEVQVIASGFDPRAELSAADATAFLRRLPAAGERSVLWAVPAGARRGVPARAGPARRAQAGAALRQAPAGLWARGRRRQRAGVEHVGAGHRRAAPVADAVAAAEPRVLRRGRGARRPGR
ncbi:hypothetical protein OHA72_41770 [Dactylosporangium sp. NBC_01737]|uniref:hypothetical protein n=1 Tax=Dactylosporangium sp. NBC_01737 TaxID=2975959 RepID=UPI002E11F251|nr:hypothetical protein OHA72_41770 [Dactylosporangium sp. NBC_01737]